MYTLAPARSYRPAGVLACLTLLSAAPASAGLPQNGWLVWSSNRADGRHEIYLRRATGGPTRRLTQGGMRPTGNPMAIWSPDGRWIAFQSGKDNKGHVIRHDGTGDRYVCNGRPEFWMHDGSGLVCGLQDTHYLVDPDTGAKQVLFKKSDFSQLGDHTLTPGGISRDGRWLVGQTSLYHQGFKGTNGVFRTTGSYLAAVALALQARDKVYFIGSGCQPRTSPFGSWIYHTCAESVHHPDTYRMSLADVATRASYGAEVAHPDADWGHEYCARVSTDGQWLTYGATTGCHPQASCDYEVFVHRLGAPPTSRIRITTDPRNDHCPHMYVGDLWRGLPRSNVKLTPPALEFSYDLASDQPPEPQVVTMTDAAGGGLTSLDVQTRYSVYSSATGWLSASLSPGAPPRKLALSVHPADLAPGRYEAAILLSVPNQTPQAGACDVTLVVHGATGHSELREAAGEGCESCASSPGVPGAPAYVMLLVAIVALSRR